VILAVVVMAVSMPVALVVIVPVVPAEVSVSIMVPMMIVFDSTVLSVPVAHEVMAAIVVRWHPMRSLVWRASPIALMPFVVVANRIPIAFYPYKLRRWWWR
jgi:hypothetical protein